MTAQNILLALAAVIAGVTGMLGYLFRAKVTGLFASKPTAMPLSMDDIPLDEIELPSITSHDKDMRGKV